MGAESAKARTSAEGAPQAEVVPPSFVGRMYNAAGGALPPEHREWVRQDLTGPGWRRRVVLRPVLLAIPFSVLFMAVPGSLQLRIPIAVGILLWTAGLSLAMSGSFRNRRLRINGLPRSSTRTPTRTSGTRKPARPTARGRADAAEPRPTPPRPTQRPTHRGRTADTELSRDHRRLIPGGPRR